MAFGSQFHASPSRLTLPSSVSETGKSKLAGCEQPTTLFAAALISAKRDLSKTMRRDEARHGVNADGNQSAQTPARYDSKHAGRKHCIAKRMREAVRVLLSPSGGKWLLQRAQRLQRVYFETRNPQRRRPSSPRAAPRRRLVAPCFDEASSACSHVPQGLAAALFASVLCPLSAILPPEVPLQRAL